MATRLSELVMGLSTEAQSRGLHIGGSPYTGISSIEVEVDVDLSNQDTWKKSQVGPIKVKVDLQTFDKRTKAFLNIGVLKNDTEITTDAGTKIDLKKGRLNFSLTNIRENEEASSVTEVLDKCKKAIAA